jgi:hypothetical protein
MHRMLLTKFTVFGKFEFFFQLLFVALGVMCNAITFRATKLHNSLFQSYFRCHTLSFNHLNLFTSL